MPPPAAPTSQTPGPLKRGAERARLIASSTRGRDGYGACQQHEATRRFGYRIQLKRQVLRVLTDLLRSVGQRYIARRRVERLVDYRHDLAHGAGRVDEDATGDRVVLEMPDRRPSWQRADRCRRDARPARRQEERKRAGRRSYSRGCANPTAGRTSAAGQSARRPAGRPAPRSSANRRC
jgi:hypothetical protein